MHSTPKLLVVVSMNATRLDVERHKQKFWFHFAGSCRLKLVHEDFSQFADDCVLSIGLWLKIVSEQIYANGKWTSMEQLDCHRWPNDNKSTDEVHRTNSNAANNVQQRSSNGSRNRFVFVDFHRNICRYARKALSLYHTVDLWTIISLEWDLTGERQTKSSEREVRAICCKWIQNVNLIGFMATPTHWHGVQCAQCNLCSATNVITTYSFIERAPARIASHNQRSNQQPHVV